MPDPLASDHDLIIEQSNWGHGTHPDASEGRWSNVALQDQSLFGVPAIGVPGNAEATLSRWTGNPNEGPDHKRGPIEMNVVFQDGSVERFDQVLWDEADHSDRMARVPFTSNAGVADTGNLWNHLPPE